MAEAKIQILIPTCNSVNDLDITVESIQEQNYDPENIYITIVDFGSNDGTYEKALGYNGKHLGIYSRPFQKNWRQRLTDAARIIEFTRPGGMYCLSAVMYPGDIMYSDCLQTISDKYIESFQLHPSMVVCESDIFLDNGEIEKQGSLFAEDCVIDGSREINKYVERGYRHQIFQMTPEFARGRRKENYEMNEGRSWNKLFWRNEERMTLYIQKPLVCTRRMIYEDELQEILYRWDAHIHIVRWYTNKYGQVFDNRFLDVANANLAEYALWRSFSLHQKKAQWKEIEDCFLISEVISSTIKEKEIYSKMQKLILEKDLAEKSSIKQYFSKQY